MAGMYPNNQVIEIFGQQVEWPGLGPDGKFTNGDFNNPMVKPSMVPAETLNLILDNLSSFIEKCGGTPNAVSQTQLADLLTHLAQANTLVLRDAHGRARIAARPGNVTPHPDDIARLGDLAAQIKAAFDAEGENYALVDESKARNLLDVLGVRAAHSEEPASQDEANAVMEILEEKINPDGDADFSGLRPADYLDLPSLDDGSTQFQWVPDYKNLRVHIAGFNLFKGNGDTENAKNHIVFAFRNCPLTKRMNASNDNTGGYPASELKTYLEGGFKTGLKAVLDAGRQSGSYLYTVRRHQSTKGTGAWGDHTVFLPTEKEVWGSHVWSDLYDYTQFNQWPVFAKSSVYRIKRYNGARQWWWEASPYKDNSASFCIVYNNGHATSSTASSVGGVSPDSAMRNE
ncbi:MAG: DUF6273 domain-containing protein [Treponematales bacterium]